MAGVAIAGLDFGAMRAIFDSVTNRLIPEEHFVLLIWGALPMANVLAVGLLICLRRPGTRPFLLRFEAFGAIALAFFIALEICFPREVLIHLGGFAASVQRTLARIIGPGRPFVFIPIICLGLLVILLGPQVAFALIGGFLFRKFRATIAPR
jgi:hypothetical protein